MKFDTEKTTTQARFGELVDVTQQAVSLMITEGRLSAGGTTGEWLRAYIADLRETAAGRDGSPLTSERARLAREQADRIALQNAVTREELAPVALLEQVLARVSSEVAGMLESIVPQLKRQSSTLGQSDYDLVQLVITKARNAAVAMELDLEISDGESGTDQEGDSGGA